ncbi:hypothetical protein ABB02_01623 [Clostridiaceae bacterium JG1575]|nr:hypothetical protein ABB02_01623 [Clostridiaceae bacterium JG1575]
MDALLAVFAGLFALTLVLFVLRRTVLIPVKVPTASMVPAIMPGDMLLAVRLYRPLNVRKGQILLFYKMDRLLIKRLHGGPGDVVVLPCPSKGPQAKAVKEGSEGPSLIFRVPVDSYLFLGDHKACSEDARHWTDPYVRSADVLARAQWVLWPLRRFGKLQ